jgi:transposase
MARSVDTHPEALCRALQRWGGKLAKIGLESGSMTPWLARELAKVGFPMVCMDARAATDAVKSRRWAGRDAADRVVPRGVCEVGRQSAAEGHAGGARSVGASQTCARQ